MKKVLLPIAGLGGAVAFIGAVLLFRLSEKLSETSREVALAHDLRFGGAKPYNSMSKK